MSRCVWMKDVLVARSGWIDVVCGDVALLLEVDVPSIGWETTPCCGGVTCLGHAPPMVL